jgi:hypothetical protein
LSGSSPVISQSSQTRFWSDFFSRGSVSAILRFSLIA